MQQSRPKAGRVRLLGGTLLPMDGSDPFSGDLYLEGGRIAARSGREPVPEWAAEAESHDCTGRWILPGFIQGHIHLCQTLFRGTAEGMTLFDWLSQVIWPSEAALEPATLEVSAEMGIHQLLASGTTTLLDMGTTHDTETVAEVAARSGIRAFLGPALMDRGPDSSRDLFRTGAQFRSDIDRLASRWERHDDGRLRIALCPRFVPSVSDSLWEEFLGSPDYSGFPVHTHGSETREEVSQVRSLGGGKTPITFLEQFDGSGGRLRIAHAVWLSPSDRACLRRMGASVCHCPSSNLKLGSGLADVLTLLEEGIPVGLGADGAACNNRLDVWQEMRLAGYIQGLVHGPERVDARQILDMATRGGAEALGIEESTGTLEVGKQADLVVLDPETDPAAVPFPNPNRTGARTIPAESPETTLVFSGSSAMVMESWVSGRRVYARDQERDWRAEWSPRIREARERLAARVVGR